MSDRGALDPDIEAAKNRAWRVVADADAAFERGELSEAAWHQAMLRYFTPRYLAGDNPRAQSGSSSDEVEWEGARRPIVDGAVDRGGSFLDVGCASGYLMESVQRWAAESGHVVEPYGLDISLGMVELARSRLPAWSNRIWLGNAHGWMPPRQFTFVRTGLEYVPGPLAPSLLRHLLDYAVEPGGRLVVGTFSEEAGAPSTEAQVASWGFAVAGRYEVLHSDPRLVRRVLWIDE